MTIEREGQSQRELSTANTGRDVPAFNHYFIFTKPEEFIHRNFPFDEKWQLLSPSITQEEFMEQAYLRPPFFQNCFKLISENKCVLTSEFGDPLEIRIGFPKDENSDLVFSYELSLRLQEETEGTRPNEPCKTNGITESDADNGRRYVLVKKEETILTLEIRFHCTGVFKLRVYGGKYSDYGNKPPWLMDVQLICHNVLPQVDPIPFDPGTIGWGPGPVASEFGLFVPSHIDSAVYVTVGEAEVISFVLQQPTDAHVALQHVVKTDDSLCDFVTCDITAKQSFYVLRIRVSYPGHGEYALRIDVRQRNRLYNACNYIVHTRIDRPYEVRS